MMERYLVVAARIRQELEELEKIVARAERASASAKKRPEDQDLYLDAAALNLHDFYTGLERIFRHIAGQIDRSVPDGPEWHRELMKQLGTDLPGVRPKVISHGTLKALDDYLRFRHVVRNIYAFEFDPERITDLITRLESCFKDIQKELLAFAKFLDEVVNQPE